MTPRCLALFYGGPDTIIPLQTGLAALAALALMFWNRLLTAFHRVFSRSKSKSEEVPAADTAVSVNVEQSREQP
jgi:hypothetical protein